MAKNGYIVGIDIGTRTVTVLIGEINEERKIEVIGIGTAESRGLRKGVVVNLDETSEAIKKARTDAELMAGQEIHAAFIGVSGAHIKSFNSRGVIAVSGRNREITQEDIRRVLEQSKAVPIPPDREIIHVIPQEFIVDEQDGIHDPLGMNGIKLEVNVHIVTGAVTLLQNLRTCIERSDIVIQSLVLNQIADAAAVLSPDEKELGVGLIDIGAGTTEVAVFERGSLWYTSIIPLGGDNFTNDIAVGLRAAIPDAEKIKKNSAAPFRPRARSRRRSRSRSSARTASPGFSPASSGRDHPAAGRGDLPPGGQRHQAHGIRKIAQRRPRPDGRDGPSRRPGGRGRGNLQPAGPARRSGRRGRPHGPGPDAGLRHARGAPSPRIQYDRPGRPGPGSKTRPVGQIQESIQGRLGGRHERGKKQQA